MTGEKLDSSMASEHEISAESPVGVFDSGVGGLTILAEIRKALPLENYVYLGDTAHCPYGMRSEAEIAELSIINCRFLIEQDAKLIIVACNTASQAALNALRATYSIPFIGVVPAVKPAARATKRGRIGVIATNQAAQAAYLHQLIADFANDNEVYTAGCPELVTLAEQGQFDGPAVEATLRHALQPLLQRDIDVLVLGCTHFPALRPAIERVVGPDVQIIDSGSAIARRTRTILESANLLRAADTQPGFQGTLQVWSSGNAESFGEIATRLLGYPVIAQHASL